VAADHRIKQPVARPHDLGEVLTLGAKASAVGRVVRISGDTGDPVATDINQHPAANSAVGAD
jgi:hypothetical protein